MHPLPSINFNLERSSHPESDLWLLEFVRPWSENTVGLRQPCCCCCWLFPPPPARHVSVASPRLLTTRSCRHRIPSLLIIVILPSPHPPPLLHRHYRHLFLLRFSCGVWHIVALTPSLLCASPFSPSPLSGGWPPLIERAFCWRVVAIATMAAFHPVNDAPGPTEPSSNGSSRPSSFDLSRENAPDGVSDKIAAPPPPSASRDESSTRPARVDAHAESTDEHDGAGSTHSGGTENGPPSKKKKGQRFFCTDFPPCTLSFTRSEHLARHIRYVLLLLMFPIFSLTLFRKHTGERPFQCHCSRRFSRLDNLRQHAQTVHVNEEIPGDSLAASGGRLQRQIRDRARGRARAGTTGSTGAAPVSRGHTRNLSTSSLTSTVSTYSQTPDFRRHPPPPPLIMADRPRLGLETISSEPQTPPSQPLVFSSHSPGSSIYTASTGYSASGGSPYYSSPSSSMSGFFATPSRRMSIPSGTRPYELQMPGVYPSFRPVGPPPPPPAYPYPPTVYAGQLGPPPPPSDDREVSPSEADWRRKTWHPSSSQPPAFVPPHRHHLSFPPPELPRPAFPFNPPAKDNPPPSLPGIESFDQAPRRFSPPRAPTPMQLDRAAPAPPGPTSAPSIAPVSTTTMPVTTTTTTATTTTATTSLPPMTEPRTGLGHRRGQISFDATIRQGLNKLDIQGSDATQWGQATTTELQNVGSQPPPPPLAPVAPVAEHPEHPPRSPTTPTGKPFGAWYRSLAPPVPSTRSPDSSSSDGVRTPAAPAAEFSPAIAHSNSDHERHSQISTSNNHTVSTAARVVDGC